AASVFEKPRELTGNQYRTDEQASPIIETLQLEGAERKDEWIRYGDEPLGVRRKQRLRHCHDDCGGEHPASCLSPLTDERHRRQGHQQVERGGGREKRASRNVDG